MEKGMLMEMISKGETPEALEALLAFLPQEHKDYGKFILLKGQWNTAQNQIHLGLEDRQSIRVEFNRISNATLEFVKDLSVSTLPSSIELHNSIKTRDKILQIVADNSEEYKYDLFFSFSNQDTNAAKEICDKLRGYGLRIFFSADDMRLKGGHQFSEVINDALEGSRHFLLYCTPSAMMSKWVSIEYTTFHDQIHINNSKSRRFLIFEGYGFSDKLLSIIHKNNQRVTNVDEILNVLLPDLSITPKIFNKKSKKIYLITGTTLPILLIFVFLIYNMIKQQNKQDAYENAWSVVKYKQLVMKGDSLLGNGRSELEVKAAKLTYEQAIKIFDKYHNNVLSEKDIKLISKVRAEGGVFKSDSLINVFEQIKPLRTQFKQEPLNSNGSAKTSPQNNKITDYSGIIVNKTWFNYGGENSENFLGLQLNFRENNTFEYISDDMDALGASGQYRFQVEDNTIYLIIKETKKDYDDTPLRNMKILVVDITPDKMLLKYKNKKYTYTH